MNGKPLRSLDFHRARRDRTIGATAKQHLDLLWLLERPCGEDFDVFHFQSNLFAQLASQCVDRLFTGFDETTGQTPTTARAKSVFQQQDLIRVIEDEPAGSDGEARVRETHAPATHACRQTAPDFADEILKTSHG